MFSRSFLLLALLLPSIALPALEKKEIAEFPDPAATLLPTQLTDDEIKACRKLFSQLASEDFDTRERALSQLIAKGPAVLPLAQEFAKDNDAEIASQARGLRQRMLSSYDGYLPASPAVLAALQKKIDWQFTSQNALKFLQDSATKAGLNMVLDPNLGIADPGFEGVIKGREGTLLEFFQVYGQWLNIGGVARGDAFYVTRPEVAQRLATQRHNFAWSDLSLSREEAARVGKSFAVFFPPVSTEIHTGSEVFSLRAEEGAITRAARLIALLKPGAPDAIMPHASNLANGEALLAETLTKPVTLSLASEDPLNVVTQLKKQNVEIFIASASDPSGPARQTPPYDRDVDGGSPLRLSLHDQPLGLALRWIERRTRFPAAAQAEMTLGFETGPAGRLQLRLQPRVRPALSGFLLGADVGFLYPRGARPDAESDTLARNDLLKALEPHLEIFPAHQQRDIVVLRGRLFMQGQYATLARTLDLLREWRAANAAPPPPHWSENLQSRLQTSMDWVAEGMSGGKVLPALRKLGKVDILLEEAADGSAPAFQLSAEEARLLPTGKYTLRALLDALVKNAGAQWRPELGVIVITPKSAEPKP